MSCDSYELGFSSEFTNEEGELVPREWDFVEELIQSKIKFISERAGGTSPPVLYLTKDKDTASVLTRGKDLTYTHNFRESVAVSKPYKGTRKSAKPIHYKNITAYLLSEFNVKVAEGVEADDLMAMDQTGDTIICSRDKDLRQVPGRHYSWECGRQAELGPLTASFEGRLKIINEKVVGTGVSFFHYQLLVGDAVDNIPGAKGWGSKKAYNLLQELSTPQDQFREVCDIYSTLYGESAQDYLREQGQLLWLVRSFDSEGEPVVWEVESHSEAVKT